MTSRPSSSVQPRQVLRLSGFLVRTLLLRLADPCVASHNPNGDRRGFSGGTKLNLRSLLLSKAQVVSQYPMARTQTIMEACCRTWDEVASASGEPTSVSGATNGLEGGTRSSSMVCAKKHTLRLHLGPSLHSWLRYLQHTFSSLNELRIMRFIHLLSTPCSCTWARRFTAGCGTWSTQSHMLLGRTDM